MSVAKWSALRAAAKRLLVSIPLVLTVVAMTFVLIRLSPVDPAVLLAGDAPSEEFLAKVRAKYKLDQPVYIQFSDFVVNAVRGDFGDSIYFQRPVFELILEHFPVTLLLTVTSLLIAAAIGVCVGAYAASKRGSGVDTIVTGISLAGYSMPAFWIGQLLILLFAVSLGVLPTNGMTSARESYEGFNYFVDFLKHMVLPVASLVIFEVAMISRFTRAATLQALQQDFIVVARAKGATRSRALWRHALPNAMVTTVTVLGLEFGFLLAGSVVTEIVFGWPGMGRLFYDAIFRRDFPMLTGCFIFTSAVVIVINMVTDALVGILDPRTLR